MHYYDYDQSSQRIYFWRLLLSKFVHHVSKASIAIKWCWYSIGFIHSRVAEGLSPASVLLLLLLLNSPWSSNVLRQLDRCGPCHHCSTAFVIVVSFVFRKSSEAIVHLGNPHRNLSVYVKLGENPTNSKYLTDNIYSSGTSTVLYQTSKDHDHDQENGSVILSISIMKERNITIFGYGYDKNQSSGEAHPAT
jgi:hypothetical protein